MTRSFIRGLAARASAAGLLIACNGGAVDAPNVPPTGAQLGAFNARTVSVSGVSFGYQVFVPASYSPSRAWPVVVALHGSGEVGRDNQKQIAVGLGPVVQAQAATFPAIVLFPQMPGGDTGPSVDAIVMAELDAATREFNVDASRVSFTGLSLGGIRGYSIVSAHPDRFAAFLPISADICVACVTGNPDSPQTAVYTQVLTPMSRIPIWIFHGSADGTVPVSGARLIYQILTQLNAPVKYTEYAGAGHPIWDQVYASPDAVAWLLAQHR